MAGKEQETINVSVAVGRAHACVMGLIHPHPLINRHTHTHANTHKAGQGKTSK